MSMKSAANIACIVRIGLFYNVEPEIRLVYLNKNQGSLLQQLSAKKVNLTPSVRSSTSGL